MANSPDADNDDDFSDLYKEYTGPLGSKATNIPENVEINKKSNENSDDEEEPYDPNAIPTDFTSREKKVWDAKSKATERNWKKRKEEEMICKLCGDSGHFTQGCPSTLGPSRKSQDFFERVPARENHVKALFTDIVVQKIEKDIGCKIKIEEKFIIVSGKDRLILKKGVDAVHKIKEGGEKKETCGPRMSRSRSPPQRNLVGSRVGRSDPPQRSLPSPQKGPHFQHRFIRQDRAMEDHVRDDLQKMNRDSPSGPRSSRSKSPSRHLYSAGNSYSLSDGHRQSIGASYRIDERENSERREFGRNSEQPVFLQTLEEMELEYMREAAELGRVRDKEEDEENNRHREAVREIRENYMKKLGILRGSQGKQWDDFLQIDAQRRMQKQQEEEDAAARSRHQQQLSGASFGGYKQQQQQQGPPGYPTPEYENHGHYGGGGARSMLPMDSRGKFPNSVDDGYEPSRRHDSYGDFPRQQQRREEYGGKAYNRY